MQFVIIELDQRRFEAVKEAGMAVVYGDAGQEIVLEAAGIKDARLLILTLPALAEAKAVITHSRRLNSRLQIIARTPGPDSYEILRDLGVSQIVLPEFEAGLELTRRSLLCLDIPPTEVHQCTDTCRQEIYADLTGEKEDYKVLSQLRDAEQQFDLQWLRLGEESPTAKKSIGESEIRKWTGASVVAVVRENQLTPNPGPDFVLQPDDLIAFIGKDESRKAFVNMVSSTSI